MAKNILITTEDPANIDTPIAGRKRFFFDSTNDDHMTSKDSGGNLHDYEAEYANAGGNNGDVQFNASGVIDGDDDLFWDNVNKRLGIGTNSPEHQFHIVNGAPSVALQTESSTVSLDDVIGAIEFIGGELTKDIVSEIKAFADEDWTDTSSPSRLTFCTTPSGSVTEVLRMTIDSTGYVGIGTGTPGTLLDVDGNANFSGHIDVADYVELGGAYLEFESGNENIYLSDSLSPSTIGVTNIVIGLGAFDSVNDANTDNNVVIGKNAGTAIVSTGNPNVIIGNNALDSATSYGQGVVIGNAAGTALTSGFGNLLIGNAALQSATGSSNRNTILGYSATNDATGGNNNTSIGANAGEGLTSGNDNIFIGYNAGYVGAISDYMNIGNAILGYLDVGNVNIPNYLTAGEDSTYQVTVAGNSFDSIFTSHVDDNKSFTANMGLFRAEATNAQVGALFFGVRQRGTLTSPLVVQSGDILLDIAGVGYDGTDYEQAASIEIGVDSNATPANDDMPGMILFKTTADGGVNPTEKMRVGADGYVGIGVTDPDSLLEVAGSVHLHGLYIDVDTVTKNNILMMGALPSDIGSGNTIVGLNSGITNNSDANQNTIFGRSVAPSLPTQTADRNVFMGYNIFSGLTLGTDRNVVIGSQLPMASCQNASFNIVIGNESLTSVSTLTSAIMIGRSVATSSTNLEQSIIIGNSGASENTGALTGSILIGHDVSSPVATTTNYLNIGNLIHADLANGYISIGTTVAKPSGTNAGDLFTEGTINEYWMGNIDNNLVISEDDLSNFTVDTASNIILGTGTTCESLIEGTDNVIIGSNSFNVLTVGYSNIIIGSNSGTSASLEDSNIIIGDGEGQPTGTNSYALNIGGLITGAINTNQVRIGGTATDALTANAALEIRSTTGAFIPPKMTTTQRNAMTGVNGMIIYNTTTNAFNFREAGSWVTK